MVKLRLSGSCRRLGPKLNLSVNHSLNFCCNFNLHRKLRLSPKSSSQSAFHCVFMALCSSLYHVAYVQYFILFPNKERQLQMNIQFVPKALIKLILSQILQTTRKVAFGVAAGVPGRCRGQTSRASGSKNYQILKFMNASCVCACVCESVCVSCICVFSFMCSIINNNLHLYTMCIENKAS